MLCEKSFSRKANLIGHNLTHKKTKLISPNTLIKQHQSEFKKNEDNKEVYSHDESSLDCFAMETEVYETWAQEDDLDFVDETNFSSVSNPTAHFQDSDPAMALMLPEATVSPNDFNLMLLSSVSEQQMIETSPDSKKMLLQQLAKEIEIDEARLKAIEIDEVMLEEIEMYEAGLEGKSIEIHEAGLKGIEIYEARLKEKTEIYEAIAKEQALKNNFKLKCSSTNELKPDLLIMSSEQVLETYKMFKSALARDGSQDETVIENAQIYYDALNLHRNEIDKQFQSLNQILSPASDVPVYSTKANQEFLFRQDEPLDLTGSTRTFDDQPLDLTVEIIKHV